MCPVRPEKYADTQCLARLCSVSAPILVGPDTDRTRSGYGPEPDLPLRRHPPASWICRARPNGRRAGQGRRCVSCGTGRGRVAPVGLRQCLSLFQNQVGKADRHFLGLVAGAPCQDVARLGMGHPIAFLSQFFQLLLFGPRKTSDKRTLSGNEVSVIVSEPVPPLPPCRQRLRPPRPALPRPSLPPNRRRHPPHPLRQGPDERVPVES